MEFREPLSRETVVSFYSLVVRCLSDVPVLFYWRKQLFLTTARDSGPLTTNDWICHANGATNPHFGSIHPSGDVGSSSLSGSPPFFKNVS